MFNSKFLIVDDEKEQVSQIKDMITKFCEKRNIEYKILQFYYL